MVSPEFQTHLDELAAELVTPERFSQPVLTGWGGELATVHTIYPDLPETKEVYGTDAA